MFWKKKSSEALQKTDTRRVTQRLYADRRMPSPKNPNLARLRAAQLEVYEACKYVQQFLNITMHGHWCVEQRDNTYGSIGAIDSPIDSVCYTVWHGDCEVGAIEVNLSSLMWEESKHVRISADLHWADCFEAHQIRNFFLSVARLHKNIFDYDGDKISDVEQMIDRAMNDALWDAFALQKEGALDGLSRELLVGSLQLSFEGDLGGYQAMLDRWKSREINVYDFERERISASNERLNR